MMYIKKPNHLGILIGEVHSYNESKGYVKFRTDKKIELGDSIAINDSSCKISELMENNNNIKIAEIGKQITIGRIKGNIRTGDKIYKTVSDSLNKTIREINTKENRKRDIDCVCKLNLETGIEIELKDVKAGISVKAMAQNLLQKAEKEGTTKERIMEQMRKTNNTIFNIKEININMDSDIFVPIKSINEIRRNLLEELEKRIMGSFKKESVGAHICAQEEKTDKNNNIAEISLLLNNIKEEYKNINNVDNVYIPLRMFVVKEYENIINQICKNNKVFIYMPIITRPNYIEMFKKYIDKILEVNNIEGFVISNISQLRLLEKMEGKEIIANYTMNVFNNETITEFEKRGITKYTISPEMDKEGIALLSRNIKKEIIVYGRALLMTSEYCLMGQAKNCSRVCEEGKYILKDRLGFEFPVYTDSLVCNTMIYNSRITSIQYMDLGIDSVRIDILDESVSEINNIIEKCKKGEKLEGKEYTNANLNKNI